VILKAGVILNQEADQEQAKDTSQGVAQDQSDTAGDEGTDTTAAEVPPPEAFEESPAFARGYTITMSRQDELTDVLAALEKGTYGVSANGNRITIYQKGCPKIVRAEGSFTPGKAQEVAEKPAIEVN